MIRKRIRAALFWIAEHTWSTGFRLLGWIHRPKAEQWRAVGGQRILVIAPHPDDETVGCGGTMIRHHQGGDELFLAILTDGRQSRAQGLPADEMASRRQKESVAAAKILSVSEHIWCGLPESNWETTTGQAMLHDLLQRIRPHIVYAPSRIDFHPEHYHVAHALALALNAYGQPLAIRIYAVHVPLTTALTNLVADTSPVAPSIATALNVYETQRDSLLSPRRSHRYAARRHRLTTSAEVFWQMPAATYSQLHGEAAIAWTGEFRGMRARPFSDPLAYLTGHRTRRTYRTAVAQRFSQNSK